MRDMFFAVSSCYDCSAWRIPHKSDDSLSALRTTGGRRAYADVCCRGQHPKSGRSYSDAHGDFAQFQQCKPSQPGLFTSTKEAKHVLVVSSYSFLYQEKFMQEVIRTRPLGVTIIAI